MSRLPFNPRNARGGDSPPPPASTGAPGAPADRAISVSQLAGLIKTALTDHLPDKVRVVGEVSNFSNRNHWFFSLKDEQATLRCVCFASSARRIRCPVEDGMQVVATGRVDFFNQQGSVQLYVDDVEPVGAGALELRLRQLIDELRGLGYFDEARKRPLPAFAERIAVVTSRSAAALQDVIDTARRRWPGCQLLLYDVRVQGEAAAPEIAAAVRALSAQGPGLGIDAVLLTRGGGSIEDLWAFNDRAVADAILACPLPVVAAIGHETATTVAELVSDLRCSTPTQAAMRLVPEQAVLEQALGHWAGRLSQQMAGRVRHARHRVDACASRTIFRRPAELVERARRRLVDRQLQLARALPHRVAPARQAVAHIEQRLHKVPSRRLQHERERLATLTARLASLGPRLVRDRRQRLAAAARHLEAVSPRRVLDRGYSYTIGPTGEVLRKPADVKPGDELTTVLAAGRVRSHVADGAAPAAPDRKPAAPAPAPAPPSAPAGPTRPRKRRPTPPDEPSLFA
ncbi:MAG: exodeoxyribonuclease VII large subunit [Phycisphaeraceae bacterium]